MKKIFIIDDDPGIQDSAVIVFKPSEYKVSIFPDGNFILSGKFEMPDIFIIDRQLPGIDGIDLCRHLKMHPSTKNLPVIIMSANSQTGKMATNAGAEGFIEKPYSILDMRKMVADCLK